MTMFHEVMMQGRPEASGRCAVGRWRKTAAGSSAAAVL